MTILKRFKLLVTLTLLSLTSCIRPPEVTLYKNLAYSSYRFQGREETLLLDLYLPEASAPLPVLVYIHGGVGGKAVRQIVREKLSLNVVMLWRALIIVSAIALTFQPKFMMLNKQCAGYGLKQRPISSIPSALVLGDLQREDI